MLFHLVFLIWSKSSSIFAVSINTLATKLKDILDQPYENLPQLRSYIFAIVLNQLYKKPSPITLQCLHSTAKIAVNYYSL